MSEAEKRQMRAEALLEAEDARMDLAHQQAKVDDWYVLHQQVAALLSQAKLPLGSHRESVLPKTLQSVEAAEVKLRKVLDYDAVLALIRETEAAVQRLEKAEHKKRSLGFSLN